MTYPRRGSAERKTPVWVGLVIHPNIITLLRNGNLCNTLRKRKKNHKDGKVSGEMLHEEPGDSPAVAAWAVGGQAGAQARGKLCSIRIMGQGSFSGLPRATQTSSSARSSGAE